MCFDSSLHGENGSAIQARAVRCTVFHMRKSRTAKTHKTCQPPKLTLKRVHTPKKSHQKERCHFYVLTDLWNSSILLAFTVEKDPLSEKIEQDENVDDENGKYFWNMGADTICRHHEVHQSKLYSASE